MENKKKYIITTVIIIVILIIVGIIIKNVLKIDEEEPEMEVVENTDIDTIVGKQSEKVTGYHLVTYHQSSNTNSFIKTLEVEAENEGNVTFSIGSVTQNNTVDTRFSFELECKKGTNTFNLLEDRYFIKQGEYLFMDIFGQDTLYREEETSIVSLVQSEKNKTAGEMILVESSYIPPFSYTLEKANDYNCMVIDNNMTLDTNLDYYALTKTRLENTFESLNMSRINLSNWEKDNQTSVRK